MSDDSRASENIDYWTVADSRPGTPDSAGHGQALAPQRQPFARQLSPDLVQTILQEHLHDATVSCVLRNNRGYYRLREMQRQLARVACSSSGLRRIAQPLLDGLLFIGDDEDWWRAIVRLAKTGKRRAVRIFINLHQRGYGSDLVYKRYKDIIENCHTLLLPAFRSQCSIAKCHTLVSPGRDPGFYPRIITSLTITARSNLSFDQPIQPLYNLRRLSFHSWTGLADYPPNHLYSLTPSLRHLELYARAARKLEEYVRTLPHTVESVVLRIELERDADDLTGKHGLASMVALLKQIPVSVRRLVVNTGWIIGHRTHKPDACVTCDFLSETATHLADQGFLAGVRWLSIEAWVNGDASDDNKCFDAYGEAEAACHERGIRLQVLDPVRVSSYRRTTADVQLHRNMDQSSPAEQSDAVDALVGALVGALDHVELSRNQCATERDDFAERLAHADQRIAELEEQLARAIGSST